MLEHVDKFNESGARRKMQMLKRGQPFVVASRIRGGDGPEHYDDM